MDVERMRVIGGRKTERMAFKIKIKSRDTWLAQSVQQVTPDLSCKFKPHIVYTDYLKIKSKKINR